MPLDNLKLLGAWEFNPEVNFKERPEGSSETFTTTLDTCGYGRGDMIFRVGYFANESTTEVSYKYFDKILVKTNNDTGVKSIAYWPINGTGLIVYDSTNMQNWNLDKTQYADTIKQFGYNPTENQLIEVTESTLLDVELINKIYKWFTENATKVR